MPHFPRTNRIYRFVSRHISRLNDPMGPKWRSTRLIQQLTLLATSLFLLSANSDAQTLTDSLQNEPAAKLAQEAIENGNAAKGAIIFARAELGCSTCHIRGIRDGLGPDLTNLQPAPDSIESTVQSLLSPSAVIREGFATVRVLNSDGQIFSGRLLPGGAEDSVANENNEAFDRPISLRENGGSQKRIQIDPSEIEQIQFTKTSLMPSELMNQLKNRQEFLDLLKYVLDLQTPREEEPSRTSVASQLTTAEQGLLLLDQFQCVQCHSESRRTLPFPKPSAPDLRALAGRLSPEHLRRFLAAPHKVKPGTPMPDVLSELPPEEQPKAINALVDFLVDAAESQYTEPTVDGEAVQRGEVLYRTVGCVACHSPDIANVASSSDRASNLDSLSPVPLGPLAYSISGLVEYLENPHRVRPSGRMPNMGLSHWEAIDLANYLLSSHQTGFPDATKTPPSGEPVKNMSAAGKEYFETLGCARCHETQIPESAGFNQSYTALVELDIAKGCLSGTSSTRSPSLHSTKTCVAYDLNETEVKQIQAALEWRRKKERLQQENEIRLSLQAFRCNACHRRGSFGGVPDSHRDYFETTNPNLGPQGRFPPSLTGVGRKLKPKWLRQVLVEGKAIRPYMKTRMPQFGTENVEHLVPALLEADVAAPKPFPDLADQELKKQHRESGGRLVGSDGLNCIACHTFQLKPAQTMPAVDLTDMHERLQPAWFRDFMLSPKSFNAGTVMPDFWPGGKASRADILNGDTDQQVAAIWEWLKDGRQARTPRGLIRKPMELVANDEAVLLRRAYPGIGKRGIGVGYPAQINIAFDAEQMRLASLWAGKFIDPSGVWRSQGHGRVRPLSRDVIQFRAGPELDDLENPWIADDGRPPEHQFKGYRLDQLRRPIFLYRFEDLSVEDYSQDQLSSNGVITITRSLKITGPARRGLAFRINPDADIETTGQNTYRIGSALTLKIIDAASQLDDAEERSPQSRAILIPLEVKASTSTEFGIQYRFEPNPK
ncbi:MAG: hypothetical protein ACE361_15345 [Aureliella sp.]